MVISCDDLEAVGVQPDNGSWRPGHCMSCHHEWDDGYGEPMEREPEPNRNGRPSGVYALVCCAYAVPVTRQQWAAAVRHKRQRERIPA